MAKGTLERFFEFLNQDVKSPTETKKNAMMIRNVIVVLVPYAFLQTLAFYLMGRSWTFVFPLAFLLLYFEIFGMTLNGKSRLAQALLVFALLVWCLLCVLLYGWEVGVQYFFSPLLVNILSSGFRSMKVRVLECLGLFSFMTSLFLYTVYYSPIFPMQRNAIIAQEILNTIGSFGTLMAVTMAFSKDTMKIEKKLIDYAMELTHLADTDTLTGLMNRRAAYSYFEKVTNDARNYGFFVNVAIGDIDFFKKINDTYGHDAGDAVLVFLAGVFTEFVKDKGVVARWGGEEFLFILNGMNGDDAFMMLDKLRYKIQHSDIPFGDLTLHVCMTFGLEEHDLEDPLDTSFEQADKKLYIGKQSGRNRVVM